MRFVAGRIREKSRLTRLQHSLPVPITPWHFAVLFANKAFCETGVKTQTGGIIKPFLLRAAIVTSTSHSSWRYSIEPMEEIASTIKQRRVAEAIHYATKLGDSAGHPVEVSCGNYQHSFNFAALVEFNRDSSFFSRRACPPASRHVTPPERPIFCANCNQSLRKSGPSRTSTHGPWRKRVNQRRLPSPRCQRTGTSPQRILSGKWGRSPSKTSIANFANSAPR